MSAVILYLWITTAAANYDFRNTWVPSGEFAGMKACEAAIQRLGVKPERARCVDSGRATKTTAQGEQSNG